jgi:hypothetical protein
LLELKTITFDAIELSPGSIELLAIHAATSVLFACQRAVNPVYGPLRNYGPVSDTMDARLLEAQAQLLYDVVKLCLEHPEHQAYIPVRYGRLITDALSAYQAAHPAEPHWTELNALLLVQLGITEVTA